jgi:hypothetical protein
LSDYPFLPASRYVEVFQGMAGGKMVAVKSLTQYQFEDPKRACKVDVTSLYPPPPLHIKHSPEIGSGSRHLETFGSSEYPSVPWSSLQPPRDATVSDISVDGKWQYPSICRG